MKTICRNTFFKRLLCTGCCLLFATALSGIPALSMAAEGDLNNDGGVDLSDVVLGLQVTAGMAPSAAPPDWSLTGNDVNGDDRMGLAEVVYALRFIAGENDALNIDAMAHVVDISGEPVLNARVGGGELTDANGVATGRFDVSPSGWVKASASGYVPGYTAALETLYPFLRSSAMSGTSFYRVELTPFGDMALIRQGESQRLYLGRPDAPVYEAVADAALFAETPVVASLTEIDPIHVQPVFEALSSGADLNLQMAFSIGAQGADGSGAQLVAGKEIAVRIQDNGRLSDSPQLAVFSHADGRWEVIENGCSRDGSFHFQCRATSLSSIYGVFDAIEPDYLQRRTSGRLARSQSGYMAARMDLTSILTDWQDQMTNDPDFEPNLNDPALQNALNDLANAARDIAAGNQNEKGKAALLGVAAQAQALGNDALASDLIGEAADVAGKMADELLAEGDCGRLREMLHVAQQNMLLGNDGKANELMEKVKKNVGDCDVWVGNIKYWLIVDDAVHNLPEMTLQSGANGWWEFHDVRMTTDVNTLKLTGEDQVRLQFPAAKYENEEEECEQSLTYGPPTGGSVLLSFDGTYDGVAFAVSNPGSAQNPVNIPLKQVFKGEDEDGVCQTIVNQTSYFQNFSSLLVHGFLQSPPITLQEMLDSGVHQEASEWAIETIRGQEEIVNPNTDYAQFPVTRGYVFWNFLHVEDMLPLER